MSIAVIDPGSNRPKSGFFLPAGTSSKKGRREKRLPILEFGPGFFRVSPVSFFYGSRYAYDCVRQRLASVRISKQRGYLEGGKQSIETARSAQRDHAASGHIR